MANILDVVNVHQSGPEWHWQNGYLPKLKAYWESYPDDFVNRQHLSRGTSPSGVDPSLVTGVVPDYTDLVMIDIEPTIGQDGGTLYATANQSAVSNPSPPPDFQVTFPQASDLKLWADLFRAYKAAYPNASGYAAYNLGCPGTFAYMDATDDIPPELGRYLLYEPTGQFWNQYWSDEGVSKEVRPDYYTPGGSQEIWAENELGQIAPISAPPLYFNNGLTYEQNLNRTMNRLRWGLQLGFSHRCIPWLSPNWQASTPINPYDGGSYPVDNLSMFWDLFQATVDIIAEPIVCPDGVARQCESPWLFIQNGTEIYNEVTHPSGPGFISDERADEIDEWMLQCVKYAHEKWVKADEDLKAPEKSLINRVRTSMRTFYTSPRNSRISSSANRPGSTQRPFGRAWGDFR